MYSLSRSFCEPASERWTWTNCFSGSRWYAMKNKPAESCPSPFEPSTKL